MKKILICISLGFLALYSNGQDIPSCGNRFIKSFMRSFDLSRVDSLRSKPGYFFSMMIKTNKKGIITSIEENLALDPALKPLIHSVKSNIDLTSLKWCEYQNAHIILPVFVLYDDPPKDKAVEYDVEQLNGLWNFKSKSRKEKIVLSPLLVYFTSYKTPVY